jgi:hypothetical protein
MINLKSKCRRGAGYIAEIKRAEVGELEWNLPREEVAGHVEIQQAREVADGRRDGSGDVVPRHVEVLEARRVAEDGRRNGA